MPRLFGGDLALAGRGIRACTQVVEKTGCLTQGISRSIPRTRIVMETGETTQGSRLVVGIVQLSPYREAILDLFGSTGLIPLCGSEAAADVESRGERWLMLEPIRH